jgi:hypothetical protein
VGEHPTVAAPDGDIVYRRRIDDPDSYRCGRAFGGRRQQAPTTVPDVARHPDRDRIGRRSHALLQEPVSAVRAGDETRERAEKLAYISRRPARAEDVGWIKLILL